MTTSLVRSISTVGLVFGVILCCPLAKAGLIVDSSFESASVAQYSGSASVGDGWYASPAAFINGNSSYSHTGTHYAILQDTQYSPYSGGIQQTVTTVAGADYLLTFWADSNATANTFQVTWAGATVAGIPTTLPNTGTGAGAYVEYTARLTAPGTSTVLAFSGTASDADASWTRLDDVTLDPVPEPATFALLGLSVAVLAMRPGWLVARLRRRLTAFRA